MGIELATSGQRVVSLAKWAMTNIGEKREMSVYMWTYQDACQQNAAISCPPMPNFLLNKPPDIYQKWALLLWYLSIVRALEVFHMYSTFLFCLKECNWGFQILGCCSHSNPGHTYLPRTLTVCSNIYAICSKECKYTSSKTVKKVLFETLFLQQMWLLNWKKVVMYPSILGYYSWVVNDVLHITFRLTLKCYECWQILNLLLCVF